jgi:hypothetical protein
LIEVDFAVCDLHLFDDDDLEAGGFHPVFDLGYAVGGSQDQAGGEWTGICQGPVCRWLPLTGLSASQGMAARKENFWVLRFDSSEPTLDKGLRYKN